MVWPFLSPEKIVLERGDAAQDKSEESSVRTRSTLPDGELDRNLPAKVSGLCTKIIIV